MLILTDSRMPAAARKKLSEYGQVIDFASQGITYAGVSGHVDLFFCPTPQTLIVAPNVPGEYKTLLEKHHIAHAFGARALGSNYPETAFYNALVTDELIVMNSKVCEPLIQKAAIGKTQIVVKQGYIRCNLLELPGGSFITSDRGIERALKQHKKEVLFVNPAPIILPGFEHGFFGGACGLLANQLFICGSLNYFTEQSDIVGFTEKAGVQIVELYDGPPFDIGTILFIA